jgi:hypothetical protein
VLRCHRFGCRRLFFRFHGSNDLASRISQVLRIDKKWLLKNDLGAPLPAGYSLPTPQEATGRAADAQTVVILELFSRLFAVIAKMEKTQGRAMMELAIAIMMDDLKKQTKPLPNCQPGSLAGSHSIEFLLQHPDLFDRDLKQWVDLKGLLKSNLQLLLNRTTRLRKLRHRCAGNCRAEPRRHLHPAVGVKLVRRPDVRVPKPGTRRVQSIGKVITAAGY